jgi:gamma-glutamylcyclotransferase (GGCT)/AIG2-like uncharacterized protein YtfP
MYVGSVFVYGTLRSGQPNARYLRQGCTDRRPAVLFDHALYGRTWVYPYATPASGHQVHGELVHIDDMEWATVLASLDRLEGYRPGRSTNHYDRRLVDVHHRHGASPAWVYVAGDPSTLPADQLITTGDWLSVTSPAVGSY